MRLPIYAQDSSDMKMNAALTTILLCLSLVTVTALAQSNSVNKVRIVSSWGGLGEGKQSELVVTRKSGAYLANGKKIPDELIVNLLSAIDAPIVTKPDLANLGITKEWLDANAEKAIKEYAAAYFSLAAPNQRELYFSSFKDQKFIEKVLPRLFNFVASDDYPNVEIEITGTDGRVIKVSSKAQPLFMLPWVVSGDGKKLETYNADIARAVASLAPKKFANRERLAGDGLGYELAKAVMDEIEGRWELLNVENKAKPYLDQLRQGFTVTNAEINPYHNVDYGQHWVNGAATETNLHAILRRPDFPKNFFIGIALPFKDGKVENIDGFLNSIDRYKDLAFSVTWLKDYLMSHPNIQFELRFVNNRSFSEKAMKIFAKDMGQNQSLVNEVAAAQKEVCLLLVGRKYYEAYWLILPDSRMVLWRFRGHDALLKWNPTDFTSWKCDDYQGDCIGAVILSDGKTVSK
jgi:hypothetical protein